MNRMDLSLEMDGDYDEAEVLRWVDKYGHPEGWAKRAQAAHGRAERLYVAVCEIRAIHADEYLTNEQVLDRIEEIVVREMAAYSATGESEASDG